MRREGKVTVDTSSVGAARVVGDRAGLGRLVRNLMDNAERHARGHVILVLQAADEVADGPGVASSSFSHWPGELGWFRFP